MPLGVVHLKIVVALVRSNTALAKSASRIALYMMREEMRESPLENGDPVQVDPTYTSTI